MRTLVLVLGMFLGGCSFVFVSGPPANYRQLPAYECTSSRAAPALDTVWAALQTSNLLYASLVSDSTWSSFYNGNPPLARKTAIPFYAVLAALGIGGMYYGFTKTGECRRARWETMQRGMQAPPPATWPPPAAPTPAPAPAPAS